MRELAALLVLVVQLAWSPSLFPGHWEQVAEQAMGHHSVRAALLAAEGDS